MPIKDVVGSIYLFIQYVIIAVVLGVIMLMILRMVLNYADMNPFSRPVILVRRWNRSVS